MLKVGQKIKIEIEKIVNGGEGLGYYENFAVFVPMSVPKDLLEIEIISYKKTYARGLILKIISPSSERIESKNNKSAFEEFDGSNFAMLKYEAQLKYKKLMVEDVMQKIAGFENFCLDEVVPSPQIYNYRNKVIEPFSFAFLPNGEKKIISGFFKRKSHEVFETEFNILNSKLGNKIIKELKIILNKYKISVYDEKKNIGILRNVMLRTNSQNEAMLVLIVNIQEKYLKDKNNNLFKVLAEIKNKFSEIKSVYLSINNKKTNKVIGEKNILVSGDKILKENIEGINFNISPTSFFQINLEQAKKIYEIGVEFLGDIQNKYVVDAYSGTGTIAMILAKKAKKVYSIELIKSATEDGKKTAKENNIKNIEFINGFVERELETLIKNQKQIDTVIFDPPRKGLESSIIDKVAELNLQEIVYISCNPSTLARDIKLFSEKNYKLKKLKAVDMFPQTSHVECVALLSK
ncbi:MAG: 23S rRNA (uracil(1939)-C(5))-methyltransferase RlmD [Fusobacterium sp.]|nr:23S rRNA (uracil(1939)-C(5))-methyltransferase RlmD [Fusobacterium sp.]